MSLTLLHLTELQSQATLLCVFRSSMKVLWGVTGHSGTRRFAVTPPSWLCCWTAVRTSTLGTEMRS